MYFNVDSDGNSTGNFFVWGTDRSGTTGGTEFMRIAGATGGVGAVGIGYSSLTSVGNNGLAVLGNVGIGTSSPGYKLQVNGNLDIINVQGTGANAFYRATSVSAVGDFSWGVDDSAGVGGGNSYIIYDRKNSAYRLVINNSGNVGIGSLLPTRKLYVQSDDSATGGNVVAVRNANSTAGAFINFIAGGSNAPSIGAKGDNLVFTADGYAGTEWGRFTSSNFLVGATSSSGLVGNNAYIVGGNFSTVNGADAIATTPTTVVTLPSRDGAAYLFSAQNISDANTTSYGVVAIITQQATALVKTDLQTASFSVITISGLNIQITSTLATKTYRWSLVRIM
jgi:hypothetical protein